MELLEDRWGVWRSAGKVCYCVIVTLTDVKVDLSKRSGKESPLLSACTGHFLDGHIPMEGHIFAHTKRHITDNMDASNFDLFLLTLQKSKATQQVRYWKVCTYGVKSKIERIPLLFSTLSHINVARAGLISDKIDQNYIIGFYGPLKT